MLLLPSMEVWAGNQTGNGVSTNTADTWGRLQPTSGIQWTAPVLSTSRAVFRSGLGTLAKAISRFTLTMLQKVVLYNSSFSARCVLKSISLPTSSAFRAHSVMTKALTHRECKSWINFKIIVFFSRLSGDASSSAGMGALLPLALPLAPMLTLPLMPPLTRPLALPLRAFSGRGFDAKSRMSS